MTSDYGELCRDIRDARREARLKHGEPCPLCIELLPRANPSILLPQQRCKIHGYRDPRKRSAETSYLMPSDTTGEGEGKCDALDDDALEAWISDGKP